MNSGERSSTPCYRLMCTANAPISRRSETSMELTGDDKVELIHLRNLYGHVLDAFLW